MKEKTERPLILLTNDDGVNAVGLKQLWGALEEVGDLVVVAPSADQSAVSLSITTRHPLKIEKVDWPAFPAAKVWSVNGTPADCVKLALNVILPDAPLVIASGINRGHNAGRNVLYSGTVAAAIEGALHGIPAAAFSAAEESLHSFQTAKSYIPLMIRYLLVHPLPAGTLLNVNFPQRIDGEPLGVRYAKQGKEYWIENPEQRQHPTEGSAYYWLGAQLARFEEECDSDVAWLRKGYITAVPIHVQDLTHHAHVERHREAFEHFTTL